MGVKVLKLREKRVGIFYYMERKQLKTQKISYLVALAVDLPIGYNSGYEIRNIEMGGGLWL
jgi:hypothetical protein